MRGKKIVTLAFALLAATAGCGEEAEVDVPEGAIPAASDMAPTGEAAAGAADAAPDAAQPATPAAGGPTAAPAAAGDTVQQPR